MKKTAYATVQDALQALPMNFGGGPSEDFNVTGNFARGSSVDLRGLGAGATLVLVNGHRQPYSGYDADFVDVSNIAWSAVDHIEVLPDGASALYGSDAIAGVVNIITRSDLNGAETQARFGGAQGGAEEKLIAQLFGTSWSSGNVLFSYQYSERTGLAASERAYAADEDKRALGGADHRSFLSNPGNILDPRTFAPSYPLPSGQNGAALSLSDLLPGSPNLYNEYRGIELLPDQKLHSVLFSGRQEIGERFELFAEGRFSRRDMTQQSFAMNQLLIVPSTNAFYVNPYPGVPFTVVAYNFADDLGPLSLSARSEVLTGTVGASAKLSDSWKVKLSESYGRDAMRYAGANTVNQIALRNALKDSKPETAFDPFGDGSNTNQTTIDAIRDTQRLQSRSEIQTTNFIADGTVFTLPTGSAKLAIGSEWRTESLERSSTTVRQFDRTVKSAFTELAVPLVGDSENVRAVPRLELSLAGRYEQYSDFGNSTNPKVGLRWAPVDSFKLRTSWGTSFKAPKLVDLYDRASDIASFTSLKDPRSAAGSSVVLVEQGSNPNLKEETAATWTAGIDFAPKFSPGTTLSLTYYSIAYDRRIITPGPAIPTDILLQEPQWTSVINRTPTAEQIASVCESPAYVGSTVSQCESTPVAAIVDLRVRNIAQTRVRGIDLKFDQALPTQRWGRFDFGLNGGYVLSFRQATSDSSPLRDVADTVGNPLALKMRGTVDWNQHEWQKPGYGVSAIVNYVGGYSDPTALARTSVSPLTTVDLRLSYRTLPGNGAFAGLEFGLNGVNVFNSSPSFVDNLAGYDLANAQPYGRVLSFTVQKSW
jgi:outer membrane receptor protein involved in Fe transport